MHMYLFGVSLVKLCGERQHTCFENATRNCVAAANLSEECHMELCDNANLSEECHMELCGNANLSEECHVGLCDYAHVPVWS
jgi:hypothetical protein